MESNPKVILLTGGSSRIGREIGKQLTKDGHVVYFGYRKSGSNFPPGTRALHLDVTQDKHCQAAIEKIISEQGRLDVLINCVGVSVSGPAMTYSGADFNKLFDVNVVGPFRMIKFAATFLEKSQGLVINITSLNAFLSYPNFTLYSATKHALEALTSGLHFELWPKIKVVNIAPGAVGNRISKPTVNMAHKPLRERYKLLAWLLPMTYPDTVSAAVANVVRNRDTSPHQILVGRDVQVVYVLKKYLPKGWTDAIIYRLWQGQQ